MTSLGVTQGPSFNIISYGSCFRLSELQTHSLLVPGKCRLKAQGAENVFQNYISTRLTHHTIKSAPFPFHLHAMKIAMFAEYFELRIASTLLINFSISRASGRQFLKSVCKRSLLHDDYHVKHRTTQHARRSRRANN